MTTIRPARPDEHAAFARLFPYLDTPDPAPPIDRWADDIAPHTLFAERDGVVVAYVFGQALTAMGYVRHLVVAPEARGEGLGRTMLLAMAGRFRSGGCARWCLNVKVDNAVALALYRSLGMSVAYPSTDLALPWTAVDALPLAPASACAIAPPDDAAIEATFGLPAGQLAFTRPRPGRVLVGLRDADRWVGFACFSPAVGGAFPFRVVEARWVRALLEAMRPHAPDAATRLHAVIDDGPAVVDALRAVGATVQMNLLHLEGALPP